MSIPVKLLLSRLADVKRNGEGWSSRCPAHEDIRLSHSITGGEDGRVLVRCHAGCSVDEICGRSMFSWSPPRGAALPSLQSAWGGASGTGKGEADTPAIGYPQPGGCGGNAGRLVAAG